MDRRSALANTDIHFVETFGLLMNECDSLLIIVSLFEPHGSFCGKPR